MECLDGCWSFLGTALGRRPAEPDWASVASQLVESYRMERAIGSGAFGVVYAGRDAHTGEAVAVKVMERSPTRVYEVQAEASFLQRLSHPNVVGFRRLILEPRHACLVMERFTADLVESLQRRVREDSSVVQSQDLVHLASQMVAVVAHLHRFSIVHRDIKSDNFMIDREDMLDPKCRLVLGDFGAARVVSGSCRLTAAVGTKIFWAPEFFNLNYGLKVDIWALGVVMYSLLAVRFPFHDEEEVRRREPLYPRRWHPDCRDFLRATMQKQESRRLGADALARHAWVCCRSGVPADGAGPAKTVGAADGRETPCCRSEGSTTCSVSDLDCLGEACDVSTASAVSTKRGPEDDSDLVLESSEPPSRADSWQTGASSMAS